MAKINILDSAVYTRIAAGEVAETPACIIKELVENSIDAGATSISIEIKSGGIDFIRVADNGKGIEKSEIKKAFLPHATSKIASTADLDGITTLGFRGEALSSIAAVSSVRLASRTEAVDLGCAVRFDNGKLISDEDCGCPFGTSVTVEGLFDKIPARKKFMQKPAKEEADVSALVSRLILANYKVSFKYTADGKRVYHSAGDGIEGAIKTIYGLETLKNMQKISLSMPDIDIYGYVSRPDFSRHNRSYQTLVINGRYVVSDEISFAVYACLKDFLMSRRYPLYILYVNLPYDMVDVNVHPKKTEVRFVEPKRITSLVAQAINSVMFGMVSKAHDVTDDILNVRMSFDGKKSGIYDALPECALESERKGDKKNNVATENIGFETEQAKPSKPFNPFIATERNVLGENVSGEFLAKSFLALNSKDFVPGPCRQEDIDKNYPDGDNASDRDDYSGGSKNMGFTAFEKLRHIKIEPRKTAFVAEKPFRDIIQDQANTLIINNITPEVKNGIIYGKDDTAHDYAFDNSYERKKALDVENSSACEYKSHGLPFKKIGTAFNTYIIIEKDESVYFIDQHAAHERILYNELAKSVESSVMARQPLLMPYIFSASHQDAAVLNDSLVDLYDCGFEIANLNGQNYSLSTVPLCCAGMNPLLFMSEFFAQVRAKKVSRLDFIKDGIMQAACKCAVKAKDDLNNEEIDALLKGMAQTDEMYCPHGRPAVVKMDKSVIEKLFKRVQ